MLGATEMKEAGMPKQYGTVKSVGLNGLIQRLIGHEGRETRADLARHFNVDRSTIGRWLEELEANGIFYNEDERRRLWIDRSRYFAFISLSRDESV